METNRVQLSEESVQARQWDIMSRLSVLRDQISAEAFSAFMVRILTVYANPLSFLEWLKKEYE